MLWQYWAEEWSLYELVSFNGDAKSIYVHAETTVLDIRVDVWSAYVRWRSRGNDVFPLAMRRTGFDLLPSGDRTGDSYFLINGWKLYINIETVKVNGVLFSDDFDTAYYSIRTTNPIYPVEVSSKVNTVVVENGIGTVEQVRDAVWGALNLAGYGVGTAGEKLDSVGASANPWLTDLSSYITPGTAGDIIRNAGIDIPIIKSQTDTLESSFITVIDKLENVAVGSSAINTAANNFIMTTGTVLSGTFNDTRNYNSTYHEFTCSGGIVDCYYEFNIGRNAIPSSFTARSDLDGGNDDMGIYAWDWLTNQWEKIGTIEGDTSTKITDYNFTLFHNHVGYGINTGKVRIRFFATTLTSCLMKNDLLFVSYAVVQRRVGFAGLVVSATSTTITLDETASSIDNYYEPSLVVVTSGTGMDQYARVIAYNGTTKTLTVASPMPTVLDSTSFIELQPWGCVKTGQITDAVADRIADQVRVELTPELTHILALENNPGMSPTQATMLLEMFNLMGLDPAKPLVVNNSTRSAGSGIVQQIQSNDTQTIITRV